MSIRLVKGNALQKLKAPEDVENEVEARHDHQLLIDGYLRSHIVRNHSEATRIRQQYHLKAWFKLHGNGRRPLFTWEAMQPVVGRRRMVQYAQTLIDTGIKSSSVRMYLGILRKYFSYVMEHPYLYYPEREIRVDLKYGNIEQPVSEYDIPKHVYNGEKKGVPFDPELLYEFYSKLKDAHFGTRSRVSYSQARNYAMAVLAGESGLRLEELIHLEISKDLFFERKKLQTRYAKGTRGSGKRSRVTLFTPLAMDTIRYYLGSPVKFEVLADAL